MKFMNMKSIFYELMLRSNREKNCDMYSLWCPVMWIIHDGGQLAKSLYNLLFVV